MRKTCISKSNTNSGFTIIELLVAMAMMSIIVTAIVTSKIGQQSQSMSQQQAVEMQQTVRAAMHIMIKEIRMAGYNPQGNTGAGIQTAGDGSTGALKFSYYVGDGIDNDSDGQIDEADETTFILRTVSYINAKNDAVDNDGDGVTDEADEAGISRDINGGGYNLMAENISYLIFDYVDKDGILATTLSDIVAVQITVRATSDSNITNNLDYLAGNNTRTLTTTVKCRNLGL